ncbi:MAG TPA: DUF413 domain-containing protein [Pirellulales bacterium]|nr:DUF413 domain-containing protein [Pirellulales bacterium]
MSEEENGRWQFTPEEAELVSRHLDFYRSLDLGERLPKTEGQRHFVAVCRCETKAGTIHEIAYVKYRMQQRKRRAEQEALSGAIDEFGEGVPKPGWFSDEGWKRTRGQYLSNSD